VAWAIIYVAVLFAVCTAPLCREVRGCGEVRSEWFGEDGNILSETRPSKVSAGNGGKRRVSLIGGSSVSEAASKEVIPMVKGVRGVRASQRGLEGHLKERPTRLGEAFEFYASSIKIENNNNERREKI